jgi:predicted DNA binding CopG/RHH family protein
MSRKIRYTDEPIGEVKIVKDFLPPPEELVFRDESVKVAISLSKKSIEFFKAEAKKHHTQYQRMIRQLLDKYSDAHQAKPKKNSSKKSSTGGRKPSLKNKEA